MTTTGSKKPCEACRYFKASEDDLDRCLHPRAERTSVQGRTWATVQREPGFFASFEWGGFCGKRGRWFSPKVAP